MPRLSTLINYTTKELPTILTVKLFYTFLLCVNVTSPFFFVRCYFGFPDDDPLGIETCRNVQCGIVIYIYLRNSVVYVFALVLRAIASNNKYTTPTEFDPVNVPFQTPPDNRHAEVHHREQVLNVKHFCSPDVHVGIISRSGGGIFRDFCNFPPFVHPLFSTYLLNITLLLKGIHDISYSWKSVFK
jgi:hypothetical protein